MYLVKYFNLFFAGLIFIGCSDYQKLLNSDNLSEKYKVAELFYNNGEYRKASRLFEQIIPKYRGKPQSQRIIYFLADSYFLDKNFYLAANQFENFIKSYPKSDRIVEAQFKEAKSFYYQSPNYSLDQEDTFIAIEKLQVFINNYPNSEFSKEANSLINELQIKLEKKDFEIAKQYYTIRDYKASIKANDNFISSYPGTKFREESMHVKLNSMYEIAINSIELKKRERLLDIKDYVKLILDYYPETLFIDEIEKKIKRIDKELKLFKEEKLPTK